MGVDYHIARKVKQVGLGRKTLTIGRQNWWCTKRESKKLGVAFQPEYGRAVYADQFFQECGAIELDTVDIVPDESPTIVADLTQPVWCSEVYDTIIELGTAEHVMDQFSFWKNLHQMLKLSGTLIVCVPANQHCGHGLVQFSPEFFSAMKGFQAEVWTVEYHWNVLWRQFIQGGRFEFRNRKPTYVFAVLKKTGQFGVPVQNATITHCKIVPLAKYLLNLPFIRNLQRLLA